MGQIVRGGEYDMMKAWFPGIFGRPGSEQESDTEKEDLMMLDPIYEVLQRTEQELGQWKAGVEDRDELLRQAYDEIRARKTKFDQWAVALNESHALLKAAYQEIAEKDRAIRELKERISAVGQVTTDVGSPGEPPARPSRVREVTDQEPAHEEEPTAPPAPPQRVPEA